MKYVVPIELKANKFRISRLDITLIAVGKFAASRKARAFLEEHTDIEPLDIENGDVGIFEIK